MTDLAALRAYARTDLADLRSLNTDPDRAAKLSLQVGELYADLGKQRLDAGLLRLAVEQAESLDLRARIAGLFDGAIVNSTEQRPALHTLLRAAAADVAPEQQSRHAEVLATRARIASLVDTLRSGRGPELGLADARDIVNIGIGGSDLGPRLLAEALTPADAPLRVHFVSNVDAHSMTRLLPQLDAQRTIFVVVSKTFTTQETLLNADLARRWLQQQGVTSAERHFLAVSANVPAAAAFGVPAAQVFPMWDWVGGRYSVWSAVGLSVALALGNSAFEQLLAGAAQMDQHFRHAPWENNLPFLSAWIGHLNRNVFGHASFAVVPYDERLRLLPMYLQQLEMESLGKSVQLDGQPVDCATAPVLMPGVGTDAQHAFFQALHQGTEVVPVDFVGVIQPDHPELAQHRVLLANLLAQSAALLRGRDFDEALASLPAADDETERQCQARHRVFPGNRPSSTILLERLNPHALGSLLALYEHKVFVQAQLWGINAFDQWGVELGKQIAKTLVPALEAGDDPSFDASTRALLRRITA